MPPKRKRPTIQRSRNLRSQAKKRKSAPITKEPEESKKKGTDDTSKVTSVPISVTRIQIRRPTSKKEISQQKEIIETHPEKHDSKKKDESARIHKVRDPIADDFIQRINVVFSVLSFSLETKSDTTLPAVEVQKITSPASPPTALPKNCPAVAAMALVSLPFIF